MSKKKKNRGKKKKSKNMKKGTNPHAHKQRVENTRSVAKNPSPQSSSQPAAMTQSLAQKRAKHALAQINAIKSQSYDKYVSYVSALPANIITSGLGQAMAMLKAGKKSGHEYLYEHMQGWLCNKEQKGWEHSPYSNSNDLLGDIVGGSEDEYIRAQAEAIEYLEWLKKFAVAFLDKEGKTSNQEGDNEPSSD